MVQLDDLSSSLPPSLCSNGLEEELTSAASKRPSAAGLEKSTLKVSLTAWALVVEGLGDMATRDLANLGSV